MPLCRLHPPLLHDTIVKIRQGIRITSPAFYFCKICDCHPAKIWEDAENIRLESLIKRLSLLSGLLLISSSLPFPSSSEVRVCPMPPICQAEDNGKQCPFIPLFILVPCSILTSSKRLVPWEPLRDFFTPSISVRLTPERCRVHITR